MGGMFKKPKAPKEKEQKWEPILSALKPASSARNGITRKTSLGTTGQGVGGSYGLPTMLGGTGTLGG